MANLKLGNVFNQFSGVTPESEQRQASSLNLANTFSGIADTLSGKDFQPGMSGFEQALIAGSRGASQGFKNKAEMEKAKRQDELNAWAQTLAEYEQGEAKKLAIQEKESQALDQVSVPAMVALAQYKQTGDKASYEGRIKQLVDSFARQTGREAVQVHVDPNNDAVFSITMKDLDDGETDTQAFDLTSLVGRASKINAEIGTQGMSALGLAVPEKPLTGKAGELQAAKKAGIEFTPEEEKAFLLGTSGKGKSEDFTKRDEIVLKNLNAVSEKMANFSQLESLADSSANKLINSGLDTGFGTDILASVAGGFNTIFPSESLANFAGDVSSLRSLLQEQVLPKVKALGAGTGISNADRDYAERTVGTVNDTPESLLEKMALQRAVAEKGKEVRQAYEDAAAGAGDFADISPSQANIALRQKLKEIENRSLDDPQGLKALTAKYQAQYLRQLYSKRGLIPSGDNALGQAMPAQGGSKVRVTNAQTGESFMIDPADVAAAKADGFEVAQ